MYFVRSAVYWIVCNVQVRYSVIENSESCVNINFENVPVAKLHDIRPRWDWYVLFWRLFLAEPALAHCPNFSSLFVTNLCNVLGKLKLFQSFHFILQVLWMLCSSASYVVVFQNLEWLETTFRFCSNLATLSQLHWLPVHDRIKFKIAIMTHKAIYTGNLPYLATLVQWHTPSRTLQSASGNLLCYSL